jgi:hypothetical protein
MKIGDHGIDNVEAAARIQKDISISLKGGKHPLLALTCRALQRSHCSGSHRDDATPSISARADSVTTGLINVNVLPVHNVIFKVIGPHWLKSPCAHMQCQFGSPYS